MIADHKKKIKDIFRREGVHVTVNHSIDDNCVPTVGFHVTIRRRRTKDSKQKGPISMRRAQELLSNYAYSIKFVA